MLLKTEGMARLKAGFIRSLPPAGMYLRYLNDDSNTEGLLPRTIDG